MPYTETLDVTPQEVRVGDVVPGWGTVAFSEIKVKWAILHFSTTERTYNVRLDNQVTVERKVLTEEEQEAKRIGWKLEYIESSITSAKAAWEKAKAKQIEYLENGYGLDWSVTATCAEVHAELQLWRDVERIATVTPKDGTEPHGLLRAYDIVVQQCTKKLIDLSLPHSTSMLSNYLDTVTLETAARFVRGSQLYDSLDCRCSTCHGGTD